MALLDFLKGGNPVAMPTDQAQPDSLEALQQVMAGNISGQLTTADKLAGLSALMRSVTRQGRQAGLTPEAAIQGVQQQALQRIQGQMQVEQLRAAQAQRQAQEADTRAWAQTLPEEKRGAFLALPLDKRLERMDTEAFRQRQLFQRERDPATGMMRNVYGSGETELTDIAMPPQSYWLTQEVNGRQEQVLYDKELNTPILNANQQLITRYEGVAPNTAASIAATNQRFYTSEARLRAGGGSDGGGTNYPTQTSMKWIIGPGGKPTAQEVRYDKRAGSWVDLSGKRVRLSAKDSGAAGEAGF